MLINIKMMMERKSTALKREVSTRIILIIRTLLNFNNKKRKRKRNFLPKR
jgi:hypothetical protein